MAFVALHFRTQKIVAQDLKTRAEQSKTRAEQSQEDAEYSQFSSDMYAASIHIRNRSTALAQRILKGIPARYRNWEWAYLADQAWLHQAPLNPSAIEPDTGKTTAESWQDGIPEKYQQIVADSGGIPELDFAANGTKIIVSSIDGSMGLYSVDTGKELNRFPHPSWSGGRLEVFSGTNKKDLATLIGYGESFDGGEFHAWRNRTMNTPGR